MDRRSVLKLGLGALVVAACSDDAVSAPSQETTHTHDSSAETGDTHAHDSSVPAADAAAAIEDGAAMPAGGITRTYFVAADLVEWDYAPSGKNMITGEPFTDDENVFVGSSPERIGRVYTKSLYREYTDATFTKLVPRPKEQEHLGFLGPVLRAEVGDTIEVTFKNNTEAPASMHPHGVRYKKETEGAPYDDGSSPDEKLDDAIEPGETYVYVWEVPNRSGPGPMDGSSVMWMYHSHTDEIRDVYAGLMGSIVVTAKGMAREDGSPKDVDRELFVNFEVSDENNSIWTELNIDTKTEPGAVEAEDDPDAFGESNLMHSMNGFVYGNLPGLEMKLGERVRWYLMAMGTEVDLHTPHFHGATVTALGMRTDVVSLMPATMMTVDMVPDVAGEWLFHCHVADHIAAGMSATYTVTE
jgi:manganese oxidase